MSLELYLGPMFAGKSSTILGIIRRNAIIGRRTLCLTSALDKRYSSDAARIISHNHESHPAHAVFALSPILSTAEFDAAECIIIEEAQFFPDLLQFVLQAVENFHKHVICVGLDGDSDRKHFGQLLDLVPHADKVQKLTALCKRCGDGTAAIFTFRKPGAPTGQVAVGGQDTYEPLCRHHYRIGKHEVRVEAWIQKAVATPKEEFSHLKCLELSVAEFGVSEGNTIYMEIMSRRGESPSVPSHR